MCRILAIHAAEPVDAGPWLRTFADVCRGSREFQGHGWGVAWRQDGRWQRYRTLRPIWDDVFTPPRSAAVLVHARSAFRDEGIELTNNMPFLGGDEAFAFNGELRGVRLATPGATGAARLFRLYERFREAAGGDGLAALERLDALIVSRTEYLRASNVVIAGPDALLVSTRFSEDPEYFTLRTALLERGTRIVCSEVLVPDGQKVEWAPVSNGTTLALSVAA